MINNKCQLKRLVTTPERVAWTVSRKTAESQQSNDLAIGGEERNINRLSLVLAASRVPETLTSWERSWSSADHMGVTVRVRCVASANDVVPHGVDNDILFGLTNAYIAANCPPDNTIQVTAYTLLVYAALPIGGHSYASLKPSLTRLRNSTFTIEDSWYDRSEEAYQSLSTSLIQNWKVIERRKARSTSDDDTVQSDALLQVTLDPDLARSIRLGYIRPVDLNILRNLTQPLTRTLYRKLNDERHPVDRPVQSIFQTALMPWAERLGINGRPDTVRRALNAPHQQLLDQGFLTEVHYLGRGKNQDVQYVFAQDTKTPARPEAVAALTSRKVTQGAALRYATEYGLEAVNAAVKRYDELLAAGYVPKNASGLLVDMLRHPLKYQTIDAEAIRVPKRGSKASKMPALVEAQETTPSLQTANFLLKKVSLPDSVKAEATELYLQGHVTAAELAGLSRDEHANETVYEWRSRAQGKAPSSETV